VIEAETENRDLLLPAAALLHLRRALRREAGPLGTVHACHDAGFATGGEVFERLRDHLGMDPALLGESAFWRELSAFFERRGWGTFEHRRIHPGLAVLQSRDWGESDPSSDETQPACTFTSGMLAYLLGRVAGGPIAVLEVGCRSRGDSHCSFVLGSEGAVHDLYGLLLHGESLDTALVRM
jgi:hypothetical protein